MNLQKISHWLLYLILFLLPLQTHLILRAGTINNSPWDYGTISLYGLDILIVIVFLFQSIAKNGKVISVSWKSIAVMSAALIYVIITSLYSLSPAVSFYRLGVFVIAGLLAYIIATATAQIKNLSLAFIAGAALSSLLGAWQFISQASFASSWLGLAAHDPSELGVSVIEAAAPDGIIERWLRAYGSLDHPNMLGALTAIALVLCVWLWFKHRVQEKLLGGLLAVALVILTFGLLLSFSRSGWIVAALGLLFVIINQCKQVNKRGAEIVAVLGIVIISGALIFSQYYYLFTPRFTVSSRLEQKSVYDRIGAVEDSEKIIQRHWLFGTGLGTYGLALQKELDGNKPGWFYQPVHNTFLLILSEIGIIGFLIFISGWAMLIAKLIKARNQYLALGIILNLALLIVSLVDHWLWSLHFGSLFVGTLLGLTLYLAHQPLLTEQTGND